MMIQSLDRMARLKRLLETADVDAAAFIPGATFRYLTGGVFHLMERPTVFIVPHDGKPVVVLPDLESEVWENLGLDATVFRWRDEDGPQAAFAAAAKAVPAKRIGVEGLSMRVLESDALRRANPSLAIVDIQSTTLALRARKNSEEIALTRKAVAVSEAAFAAAADGVKIGMTEREIQRLIMHSLIDNGAQGPINPPTVLAGATSAMPHGHAGDYRTRPGDALLIDFSTGVGGYRSDITRTFFLGKVSDEDRAFYECVLAANEKGREIARPGITAHELDDAVRGHLEASRFADYVVHKTGHGIGIDVHEAPQIMRGNHVALEPGNILTIEPGLYHSGRLGVRIEDDVLITEDGSESLSTFPRELRVIG